LRWQPRALLQSDCIEVDAIVQLHDGRWGAIEIKLGKGRWTPPPPVWSASPSRSTLNAPVHRPFSTWFQWVPLGL